MNTFEPTPSAGRKRRLWYLLPIALLLAAGAFALRSHRLQQAEQSPPPEAAPWAVQTGVVERGRVGGRIHSVATVEAPNAITLSPQIQGRVLAVGPRAGVAVERGELLVRIDARSIERQIAALEQQRIAAAADADYAVKDQRRIEAVLAEGGVSQAQADLAHSALDSARARMQSLVDQIAALRVQLGYAEMRAPQDAVVAQRLVEVGDTAVPGKPVYRLTAGRGAVVRVSLPAGQLAQVKPGDPLELTQDGATLALPISRIAPAVDAAGLGFVEADTPQVPFGLPSGTTLAAMVHTAQTSEALTVPVSALVGSGATAHVVVFAPAVQAGAPARLHRVPVRVLLRGAERAAVAGALEPGVRVVTGQTAVLARLREGDAAVATSAAETAR